MTAEKITQAEAARRLGMTPQALGLWARRSGAPVEVDARGRSRCLWPAFPRWYADQREEAGRAKARPRDQEQVRLRRELAEAELREFELAERRGQLVRADQVTGILADAFGRVASKLKHLPRAIALNVMADTIAGREAQATRLVDEVMTELAAGEDVPEE